LISVPDCIYSNSVTRHLAFYKWQQVHMSIFPENTGTLGCDNVNDSSQKAR